MSCYPGKPLEGELKGTVSGEKIDFNAHNNRLRFLKRLPKGFAAFVYFNNKGFNRFYCKTHTNEGELISQDLKIYIFLATVPLKIGWRVQSMASSTCPLAL